MRQVFQHLQHVNCLCGQRDFPSPDASITHIQRSQPKDKDSVTFCAHHFGSIYKFATTEKGLLQQQERQGTSDFQSSDLGLKILDLS